MRRGKQRILAAGNVAACILDWQVLVPKHHAGHRLKLYISDAGALDLGEVAHLRLRELDVLPLLRSQAFDRLIDLGLRKLIVFAIPAIELDRHVAQGIIAALFDVGKGPFHGATDVTIALRFCGSGYAALEPDGHCSPRRFIGSVHAIAEGGGCRPTHSIDARLSTECFCRA